MRLRYCSYDALPRTTAQYPAVTRVTAPYGSWDAKVRPQLFAISSPKMVDMTASHHRVLMNFQLRECWTVHFLEADCKTALWPGRYYDFESVDRVREILVRAAAPAETFLSREDEHCGTLGDLVEDSPHLWERLS